jgi:hypothetical protein
LEFRDGPRFDSARAGSFEEREGAGQRRVWIAPGGDGQSSESFRGFPAFWQHIECQRVTVGELIAFHYSERRQHMPDAIIVEDVTLAGFAHDEAIHFVFVIVGDDDFATVSAAAAEQMRGDVLFPVFM